MGRIITDTQLRKAIKNARAQGQKSISVDRGLRLLINRGNRWEYRSQTTGAHDLRRWIGTYPEMTLAEARAAAQGMHARTVSGDNVRRRAEKERDRQRELSGATVADLWPEWWAFMEGKHTYKNLKDYARNSSRWRLHVLPEIGRKRPADVKPSDIAVIYNRVSSGKTGATMLKVRALLNYFYSWCVASSLFPEDARLPTDRDRVRPFLISKNAKVRSRPHPMSAVPDMPRFIAALVNYPRFRWPESGAAMGLLFSILTVSRSGNIGKGAGVDRATWACWRDLSEDWQLLTVPAERMKETDNGQHLIPLSEPCRRILRRLEALGMRGGPDDPIFPGDDGGALSSAAMLEVIKAVDRLDIQLGGAGFKDPETGKRITQHGTARATFRSWAQDTGQNMEAAEMCMHHLADKRLGHAYARGKALEPRRRILEQWAEFCMSACPPDWDRID